MAPKASASANARKVATAHANSALADQAVRDIQRMTKQGCRSCSRSGSQNGNE